MIYFNKPINIYGGCVTMNIKVLFSLIVLLIAIIGLIFTQFKNENINIIYNLVGIILTLIFFILLSKNEKKKK